MPIRERGLPPGKRRGRPAATSRRASATRLDRRRRAAARPGQKAARKPGKPAAPSTAKPCASGEQPHPSPADLDARFRLLVEGVAEHAILMLDENGAVETWNLGAERIKGYRRQEILGRHFAVFYPAEDVAAGKPERLLLEAKANGASHDEGWRVRKDGTRFWANVSVTALRDAAGGVAGFAKVTRDESERREAQQRIARLHAALERQIESRAGAAERASRDKSALLACVSHELRTPLNGILGLSEYLLEPEGAADPRESARTIHAAGAHMLKVLNGLLELSRNEAGMAAVERAPLRLRELLEDVAALYRAAAESKRVALSLSVAPDVPELLHSDATRLREVLDNLCHNAVKFTARGEVRLAAAREGENLLLTVADTGPGIEREDLSRIFMPFARGGNARGQEGCGLGLSLVKGAIESLGGGVRVASTPGVGSTFTVWHPLAVDEASPEA